MGIALVCAAVVIGFLVLVWRYARKRFVAAFLLTGLWLGAFAALSISGVLARFDQRPPPFVFMLLAILIVGIAVGRSRLLDSVPFWLLVGFEGFRLPLELAMHETARAGIMPNEMSFTGYNFDIVSGITALIVAFFLKRGSSPKMAYAWNVLGLALLAGIVTIALLASPLVRAFGDGSHVNTFVAHFPYVYLPTVAVLAALVFHVALFRRMRRPAPLH
jgi:hypothetical protein